MRFPARFIQSFSHRFHIDINSFFDGLPISEEVSLGVLNTTRSIIGRVFGGTNQQTQGQQLAQTVTVVPTTPPAASPAQTIHVPAPAPLSVGNMTPEQLKARRTHQIENANIGKSRHVRFFIFLVTCWLFVGPIWYVVLTTSEVGWALSQRSFNWQDQTSVNFYAGALFIELGMMFCTFFLAYLRQAQVEHENSNPLINKAVMGLTVIWLILAAISAFGQFYYLFNASGVSHDTPHVLFITSRVIAFTVVDFASAFYLSRIQSTLDELMEANRKKGRYHVEMAGVDADLMQKEMEANNRIEQAKIDLEDKKQKNEIGNRVITLTVGSALRELEEKFGPPKQPPNSSQVP
jgi:hypothetical protein